MSTPLLLTDQRPPIAGLLPSPASIAPLKTPGSSTGGQDGFGVDATPNTGFHGTDQFKEQMAAGNKAINKVRFEESMGGMQWAITHLPRLMAVINKHSVFKIACARLGDDGVEQFARELTNFRNNRHAPDVLLSKMIKRGGNHAVAN